MSDEQSNPVSVPAEVFKALEMVRRSGLTNMLDRPQVARLAEEFGHPEAATWLRTHRAEYAKGIFRGFVIAEKGVTEGRKEGR